MSADCVAESIGRIDILELATYARNWCYFMLIFVALGFISKAQVSVRAPLLPSNFLLRTVGESVPMLYSRTFISLWILMIVMVLYSACLIAMYLLSVELRGISVWSCDFHITVNPKYDTTNPEQERAISGLYIDLSGNQIPLKSASAHTLTSLLQWRIYVPNISVPFRYLYILFTSSPCGFI